MALSEKALDLTESMTAVAIDVARSFGVSPSLSDHDQLLGYIVKNSNTEQTEAVKSYFSGGRVDALTVVSAITEAGQLGGGKKILEFASGFGRVSRHLDKLLPDNDFTASDIHDKACDLIKDFGVKSVVSSNKPEDFAIDDRYDFIFVLSLFSHLPDATFGPWLAALYSLLEPGGSLLFTTHGEAAFNLHRDHFGLNFDPGKGFGFRPESDQQDLASSEYGTAVVTIPYVYRQIERYAEGAAIKSFRSQRWFGLQDEWVIQRPL